MTGKTIFSAVLFLILALLLLSYYFLPYPGNEFFIKAGDVNEPSYISSDLQFYPNMRFSDREISYKIIDCNLNKVVHMKDSFNVIENLTVLKFYPINDDEEITITCSSGRRESDQNGFFVAGEGGPINITVTDNYNVIHKGKILLLRESKCPDPNVGLHELFHVLGFTHSPNPDSIMYEISKCSQVITNDIVNEINRLYEQDSMPDLIIKNFTASNKGRYLDASFSVVNHGLKKSDSAIAILYVNDEKIEEISLESIDIGYGTIITLKNVRIPFFGKVENIILEVKTSFDELNKKNNKIELKVS